MSKLFQPIKVGSSQLKHRIVMAPLTRYRADKEHVHGPLAVDYYSQRASTPGTLLITEATFIAPRAGGMDNVPGIWSDEQIAAWKKVTDAVHKNSSFIFLQLWALGRAAFPDVMERDGLPFVSASDLPIESGKKAPKPLSNGEVKEYVGLYAQAAKNAVLKAGFDGVEIHGANGYLIDQFTQDVSNKRTDEYGGSVENRSRFALEIVKAVTDAVGEDRTGIRFSPWSTFQAMSMSDPKPTFSYLIETIKSRHPKFAYVHLTEPVVAGDKTKTPSNEDGSNDFAKAIWLPRPLFLAGGLSADRAKEMAEEEGVVPVFGRYFISNPDLPKRIRQGIEFTPYNRKTFYTPGPDKSEGYTDYAFAVDSKM